MVQDIQLIRSSFELCPLIVKASKIELRSNCFWTQTNILDKSGPHWESNRSYSSFSMWCLVHVNKWQLNLQQYVNVTLTKHWDISQANKKSESKLTSLERGKCTLSMRKNDEHTTVTINWLANSCAHTVTIVFLSETNPNTKRWRYHHICIITTRNGNDCGSQRKWQCLSNNINKEEHKFWTGVSLRHAWKDRTAR